MIIKNLAWPAGLVRRKTIKICRGFEYGMKIRQSRNLEVDHVCGWSLDLSVHLPKQKEKTSGV